MVGLGNESSRPVILVQQRVENQLRTVEPSIPETSIPAGNFLRLALRILNCQSQVVLVSHVRPPTPTKPPCAVRLLDLLAMRR